MDFDFTEEQMMLRGLARELLAAECSPREVRAQMEDATGYSESLWQQLAETGLLGITIDEGHAGASRVERLVGRQTAPTLFDE